MKHEIPPEVLDAFFTNVPGMPAHDAAEISVEIMGGGLINHSYKVTRQDKPVFLLQQINKKVFADPRQVQENYLRIWEHANSGSGGLHLPSPVYCGKAQTLFVDRNNHYWRAFTFIDNSRVLAVAANPEQARSAAKAFGRFTSALHDFDPLQLKEVIAGFHDLDTRYLQFVEAQEKASPERMEKALTMISQLKQRERYKNFFGVITRSGEFPRRVMHHDAKISNVLFNNSNDKVICLVDFDTVMPGYFFSDLGDMIRSMACSEAENSTPTRMISIKKNFYEVILKGYLDEMEPYLTHAEKKYIHYSGLLMIYMQALRFVTDYLDNDNYYRINYPEQNLDRAGNQLVLLERLEDLLVLNYAVSL